MRIVQRLDNPLRDTAITFEHLGKLAPLTARHLADLRIAFSQIIPRHPSSRITVLGLAESGIVPSYCVATLLRQSNFNAEWLCSTRTAKNPADKQALRFRETHSHAPDHFLPPDMNESPPCGELWIVEDELTTGQTILNLLESLPKSKPSLRVRIFSILDVRSVNSKQSFLVKCGDLPAKVSCHSILSCESMLHDRAPMELYGQPIAEVPSNKKAASTATAPSQVRYAVGEEIAQHLDWLDAAADRGLRQLSLSPWSTDGRSILSRHAIGKHFLYNASTAEHAHVKKLLLTTSTRYPT